MPSRYSCNAIATRKEDPGYDGAGTLGADAGGEVEQITRPMRSIGRAIGVKQMP